MSFIRTLQVIVFLLFGLASNAHGHSSHIEYPRLEKVNQNHADLSSQTVYVCLGEYAYAYHSRSDCPGLSNCKGSIKYTDESREEVKRLIVVHQKQSQRAFQMGIRRSE